MTDAGSLFAVTDIYTCCASVKLTKHQVEHKGFKAFFLALRRLEQSLKEETGEDDWKHTLRVFRDFRNTMRIAPLPFDHYPMARLEALHARLSHCGERYPQFSDQAHALLAACVALAQSHDNPLLDAILPLCENPRDGSVALLIKRPDLISATEKAVKGTCAGDLDIVVPAVLKGEVCYQQLVVVGSPRWYREQEFVFTAPRARSIHLVYYDWFRDKWFPRRVFEQSMGRPCRLVGAGDEPERRDEESNAVYLEDTIDTLDVTPATDWDAVANRISSDSFSATDEFVEEVDARACALEGGHIVFLNAEKDSKVLAIDLYDYGGEKNDDSSGTVKRISAFDIEPGMFILLRTSGGGDYIVPVADAIMGDQAPQCRDLQRMWKVRLREGVEKYGLGQVAHDLTGLGATKANEINIRNWMSERTIRPSNDDDFDAILAYAHLSDRSDEFHRAAKTIGSAHRRAGFHIRKRLLKQVLSTDLRRLKMTGRMNFELPHADGGALTAFLVTEISRSMYHVPVQKLNHPFAVGEEQGFV